MLMVLSCVSGVCRAQKSRLADASDVHSRPDLDGTSSP